MFPNLAEEVKHALKKMKKGKSAGPDNVPIELITAQQDIEIMEVIKLLNIIYDTGEIPHNLTKSVFIAIPKNPGTTDCEQHRTISLMSQLAKVLLRVLLCRMRSKIRPEISEKQFGFVADRGQRNAIFTLNMLLERSIEVKKDICLCFIDYSKAFEKVRHDDLIAILMGLNIDAKELRILRNLYWGQTEAIRIENEISEYRATKRGVRQGCAVSHDLFNL